MGLSVRYGMGWGTLSEVRDGSLDLREVQDELGDPRGGSGWVGGP